MTCIATDGVTMAGDGRITSSGLIINEAFEKVWLAADGSIIGACGDQRNMGLARDWLDKGANFDVIPKLNEEFEALVLRPDGRLEIFDCKCVFVPINPPAALGSGRESALTAMDLGLSPGQAVRQAMRRVSSVGGRVVEMKMERRGRF